MKTISIKTVAGVELIINPNALSYLRLDPSNETRVQIYLNNGECHTVKYPMLEIVNLFKENNK